MATVHHNVANSRSRIIAGIVATARCAASHGQVVDECAAFSGATNPDSARMILNALAVGERAARHGRALPLAPILDVMSVLTLPSHRAVLPHRPAQSPEMVRAYDKWLCALQATLRKARLARHRRGAADWRKEPSNLQSDLLPILLEAWPCSGGGPIPRTSDWAAAYAMIRTEAQATRREAIRGGWNTPQRDAKPEVWRTLRTPSIEDDDCPCPQSARMWSTFTPSHPICGWPEGFDHGAGHVYLDTRDPDLLPDQARRIQHLKSRRPRLAPVPLPMGCEEQAPTGVYSLAALIPDDLEEVAHRIMNHETLHLNVPPRQRNPNLVRIHIGWQVGYGALRLDRIELSGVPSPHDLDVETEDNRAIAEDLSRKVVLAGASVLQGFVGLLLDDWRFFLRGLPVRFYLHRGCPRSASAGPLPTGTRWKETSNRGGPLPPAHVVNTVFERHTYVSAASAAARWQSTFQNGNGRAVDSWFVCMLRSDLPEFGFPEGSSPTDVADFGGEFYEVAAAALPDRIACLVVLDPGNADHSQVCAVDRLADSDRLRIYPMPINRPNPRETPFGALRYAALDLLLGELERKLH